MDKNEVINRLRALNTEGAKALEEYLNYQISVHHKTLETAEGTLAARAQGSIAECRMLLKTLDFLREPRS